MSVLFANFEANSSRATTIIDLSESFRDDNEEETTAYLWHAATNGADAAAI